VQGLLGCVNAPIAKKRGRVDRISSFVDEQERTADVDLVHRLDRIEAKLDLLLSRRVSPLSRSDVDRLAKILPVCGATFGSELFAMREVTASASPGLRLVCKGLSTKQLGKLFRRGEGRPIGGFVVVRDGVEDHVILRRVLAC
jgi:hypothetical protein